MATRQVVVQALQIRKKKEFGPIAIALPAKWPGMQMSLNQVRLSKDRRDTTPMIGLARAPSTRRLNEEPEAQQFIVIGNEDQLATGNQLLSPVLGGRQLKHGDRLSYSQLLAFDERLNGQMRAANAAFADALDLLAPAIEIDAAHFKCMIRSIISKPSSAHAMLLLRLQALC